MFHTTFKALHDAGACSDRYHHLARALGGIRKYGRTAPITLLQILDANGFDDALWALRACPGAERFARELACDYAEHVLPIFERECPDDTRPRVAIDVVRRYARGDATEDELAAAGAAAGAAARAAAWAAADDAWAATDAARAAAHDAQNEQLETMVRVACKEMSDNEI